MREINGSHLVHLYSSGIHGLSSVWSNLVKYIDVMYCGAYYCYDVLEFSLCWVLNIIVL